MTTTPLGPFSATKAWLSLALAFALSSIACPPAQALDIVDRAPAVAADASSGMLALNGAGTRRQGASSLYRAELRLEQPAHAMPAVLSSHGGTQLLLTVLRDTSPRQLTDLLTAGLVANTSNDNLAELVSEIFDVGLLINAHGLFRAGDTLQMDANPLTGTSITIGSAGRAPADSQSFANPHLFPALMGIWLGEHPVDAELKRSLLGTAI